MPIPEQKLSILSIDTALPPTPMLSARSSLFKGSRLPPAHGGESTPGLASFSTAITPVPAPARSIEGLLADVMHTPSRPLIDSTFGTIPYESNRVSRTSTLPERGPGVLGSIEPLSANMYAFSNTSSPSTDDLVTTPSIDQPSYWSAHREVGLRKRHPSPLYWTPHPQLDGQPRDAARSQ